MYENLFRFFYVWSRKSSLDGDPSLLAAVLFVSALEFMNIISICLVIESIWGARWPESKTGYVLLQGVVLAANIAFLAWGRRYRQILGANVEGGRSDYIAPTYLVISVALFALGVYVLGATR